MIIKKIFNNKINFYKLLNEQSAYIAESVCTLESYVKTLNPIYADKVKRLEKEADDKRWELVQDLTKTFITPMDREDIFMLSKSLDDILDYYKATVNEMEIYQVESSPELISFVSMLKEGTMAICSSVQNLKSDKTVSIKYAVKAKKCENKVEAIYRESVAKLLQNDDIKYIIKMRELYRHLSNCADRIDQSADWISHILMKAISS